LKDKKYSIDYYQREYKWEDKQLAELISDLTEKFLHLHDPSHKRTDVSGYAGYFLGSIIISQKGTEAHIVDGQQRLTTLTLILTYLRRLQKAEATPEVKIDDLIYSESYGQKSFNLDIPDRADCMSGLFEHGEYEPLEDDVESVRTLVDRYSEIDGLFPEALRGPALPYFIDWLKDRVQVVQITAYNDDDAYAIFETMNDRGLKLTPADMLKGYLLANIDEGAQRVEAARVWRKRLRSLEDRDEGLSSDFLKTWLRSQYSTKVRRRTKDARPEDWDRIGTEFHRWLRGDAARIGLTSPDAYHEFVTEDLDFYARKFEYVKASESASDPGSPLRFIRFNADQGFTLQYQMLLAPLIVGDDEASARKKLEIVARFVDILLAWRVWNFRAIDYNSMQYSMTNIMFGIRGRGVEELARRLFDYLSKQSETFDSNDELRVHQQNRRQLHRILARLTDHVSVESGLASNYLELTGATGVKYEVEHVWANHYAQHSDEFAQESEFDRRRNHIGDLLLLPKQHNASYNDEPYSSKRPRYYSQNLLAASLDPQTYERNPGFRRYIERSGLDFRAYDSFGADSILERGRLYREIAKEVWNPSDLLLVAGIASNE